MYKSLCYQCRIKPAKIIGTATNGQTFSYLYDGLYNLPRTTANGILGQCARVSRADARPGDLIFFQGTYSTSGASHVGIYVGDGMMVHCGNPISYASIDTPYWRQHFLTFGRFN